MKRFTVAACLALVAGSTWAEPMMKAGLWEMRIEKQVMDGQDMTAAIAAAQAELQKMMANMPPERRKQMEQAMGGKGIAPIAGGGSPNASRLCISPEMAARDKPVAMPDGRCEPAKTQRSGNRIVFELNCQGLVGKGESVITGDSVSSRMDMTMSDARGKHEMHMESRMNYLGPDCKGLKPLDQIAREMQAPGRK
ncbi:DUF3617 domain-containing protein [Zoogloea sp.]|uniref:DUF3617 domain-containing protein n=1 Tax=Zoogloea sp. TaxID=49181 RepID=UPI00321FF7CF